MKTSFQSRCIILCLVLVAGLSVLSARLVQIQLVDRKRYADKARDTYHRTEVLPGTRGMIVDRREEPLARSMPVVSVFVDMVHIQDPNIAAFGLAYQQVSADPAWRDLPPAKQRQSILAARADILRPLTGDTLSQPEIDAIVEKHLAYAVSLLARPMGMRRDELHDKIAKVFKTKKKELCVAKDLPQEVGDRLREVIDTQRIQGFDFENSLKRWYTAPNQATHVIGYTGEDQETHKVIGQFGIEKSMDTYLTGRDGSREHMRDVRGLVVPGNPSDLIPPRAGLNVKLTLDMGLQAIVEEELDAGLAEFRALKGSVILMDPKTGEILAMASRPHFNLNTKENVVENGYNYAIQSIYEPGSTIKIVATSGALNEGLVGPQTSIFCYNGYYQGRGYFVKDDYPAGSLTFEGVLQKSNNNGTCSIGRQLGAKRFYDYLHNYGFGKKTGILLSGESSGVARNTNNEADFSRACFGYATNVTPLQLACAYSVIASDGKLRKPHIVKSIIANDGTVVQDFPPEVVREVLKPKSAAQMRSALEKVVLKGGTATKAAVSGFLVAGKTGTVAKFNPKAKVYWKDRFIASFAGMMPAQDPAFVCVVVIDDPRTENTHGGAVAGPIFSRIATRVAAHMNLQPTEPLTLPIASAQ